jgi:hypothetical protein
MANLSAAKYSDPNGRRDRRRSEHKSASRKSRNSAGANTAAD